MRLKQFTEKVEIDTVGDMSKPVAVPSIDDDYPIDVSYWAEEQILQLQDTRFIQKIRDRLSKVFSNNDFIVLISNIEAGDPQYDTDVSKLQKKDILGITSWFSNTVKLSTRSFTPVEISKELYKVLKSFKRKKGM